LSHSPGAKSSACFTQQGRAERMKSDASTALFIDRSLFIRLYKCLPIAFGERVLVAQMMEQFEKHRTNATFQILVAGFR
jgi:hypothetical protein